MTTWTNDHVTNDQMEVQRAAEDIGQKVWSRGRLVRADEFLPRAPAGAVLGDAQGDPHGRRAKVRMAP